MKKHKQLIILDRDGVINYESDAYIKTAEELRAIPSSLQAIAKLNRAGYLVAIATNQSGLARGYFTQQDLDAIHLKMQQALAEVGGHIDAIFYCPHHPDTHCACRKPKPGLLFDIADHFQINLDHALLVGDSLRDIEAAHAANCDAVMVRTGKPIALPAAMQEKVLVFDNLHELVDMLLNSQT